MAPRSGLALGLFVAGHDVGGDTQQLGSVSGRVNPLDTTPITKSAFRRTFGIRDGNMAYVAYFNPGVAGTHDHLSDLPTTDQSVALCIGTAIGSPVACALGKQLNYDPTRATDGSMTFAVDMQGTRTALEWGELHTAATRTDAAAANGAGVDSWTGASTAFGLQAYLQVLSLGSGSPTVKLQESSDNGGADAWADVVGGAFTAVGAAPSAQRIETARTQTIERYLRVITTGSFTNLVYLVAVTRNQALTAATP